MALSPLELAAFLALCAKSIADAVCEPLRRKFPALDLWWMVYAEWVIGGALALVAGVNLFTGVFVASSVEQVPATILAGKVLTAILVGGGAKLIFKVFNR